MVDWTKKWKNAGGGWFGQPGRHSQARKYGSAGGSYTKNTFFAKKPDEVLKEVDTPMG